MGYIVKVGDNHYIKRTARFGAFHGSVVYTDVEREARVWTRENDARQAMLVLAWRVSPDGYDYDAKKYPGGSLSVIEEKIT